MRSAGLVVFAASLALGVQATPSPAIHIGVVDDRSGEFGGDGFAELRALRFTVVATRDPARPGDLRIHRLPATSVEAIQPPLTIAGVEVIAVNRQTSGAELRERAWVALGRGLRGIIFDGWTALGENRDALAAAATFTGIVTRNAVLFAPLAPAATRAIAVDAATPDVFARFLESPEALVLVAANLTSADQRVTLKFSPEIPEAIWQNMEHGGSVNFVAGPEGPIYTRVFPAHDVVVLMIRKQYK